MKQERAKHKYAAVIQAGGMGTRMKELTGDKLPKPMLMLNGKPMLEWQIQNIAEYGIRDFVIIVGHLGEKIEEYFQDGARWGVMIRYIREEKPLGSAGALAYLKTVLLSNITDFFLVFGDVMFDLDLNRMVRFHESHCGFVTLLAHPNAHPGDSDLLVINQESTVEEILSKNVVRHDWYDNIVNAGIYILSKKILDKVQNDYNEMLDMEKDILLPLLEQGEVYAYRTPEYVKDAGTPERFRAVCQEQAAGIWRQKNLRNKQRCVFLDRDGTINRYRGLIYREDQLELEETAAEAIRLINKSGYLAIIVTNQPVVARGDCSLEEVRKIHRKLQVLLGENGAWVDDIVFCPHHPDKGYAGENVAYKISCNCRKPATGMIDSMVEKYNVDIDKSYMVGDSTVDVQTGKNAGLKTVLLSTGQAGKDGKYDILADIQASDLLEATKKILEMNVI